MVGLPTMRCSLLPLYCGLALVLAGCHMSDPTNPIYREGLARYFAAH